MSISIAGINLADGILDAQYRLAVLERIVQHLLPRIGPDVLTQADLERFRTEALAEVQKKYPDAGVKIKSTP